MLGMPSPKSPASSSVEALRLQHGFDAISLMPTNLYGPGDNYHQKDSHVLPAPYADFTKQKLWCTFSALLADGDTFKRISTCR